MIAPMSRRPTATRLLGRETELRELDGALERASAGQGSLLLVTGEAGIGKSRVLEAMEEMARHRGFRVGWGRAWEVGPAPAFWPWLQVFRALSLPWERAPAELGVHSRLAWFDSLAWRIGELATSTPVVVLLDDMHAADEASLQLLLVAGQTLAAGRLVLVAAARDAEIQERAVFDGLARLGRCLAPRRLSLEEVAAWVGDEHRAATVHDQSDGLPLFVEELILVGSASPGAHRIWAVLDAHLKHLPPHVRRILERAAVIGRTFDIGALAGEGLDDSGVARAIASATEARVVEPEDSGRYRFTHVLLRDRLYDGLDAVERTEEHDRLGTTFADRGEWSPAVHHLMRGARADIGKIAKIALEAARGELGKLGFESAAALAATAIDLAPTDTATVFELTLLQAEASFSLGLCDAARSLAGQAHDLASADARADDMARAALVYGRDVFVGRVDPRMVHLLKTALAAGPSEAWAPRVLARLAAARVPPRSHDDARWAVSTAAEAIARARRHGDQNVLLETLRHAASAHGYLVPREKQLRLTDELLELAVSLGRHDIVGEVAGFAYGCRREAGRADAEEALMALEQSVPRLGAHQQWRLVAAWGTRALFDGTLATARQCAVELATLGRTIDVAGARVAAVGFQVGLAVLLGDDVTPVADLVVGPAAALFGPLISALNGKVRDSSHGVRSLLRRPDSWFPQHLFAAVAAMVVRDPTLAKEAGTSLGRGTYGTEIFFGPGGVYCAGPSTWILAELDHVAGCDEAAATGRARALELAEQSGFRPLVDRLRTTVDPAPPCTTRTAAPDSMPVALDRIDGQWRLLYQGRTIGPLPEVKGMSYLSVLLAHPDRDFSAVELAGAEYQVSDAGELLDERAIASYRARARDLRARLDEAADWGDIGRRERAAEELEALEGELSRALGLGGRRRVASAPSERARINVQRRLKDAVARIRALDPDAGAYLGRALRTGSTCCYRP
jgi:hypothetical protein